MDHRDCLETLDLQVQEVNLEEVDPPVSMDLQGRLVNQGSVDLQDFHHQWTTCMDLQGTLVVQEMKVQVVLLEILEILDLKDGEEVMDQQEALD